MEIKNLQGDLLFRKDGHKLGVCELDGLDLAQADLRGFDFQMIMLDETNMAGADLSGAMLYWCVLVKANLEGSNLERANLQGTVLSCVNFKGANLQNANLAFDNLGGATAIKGSDFTDATLTGAIFTGAWYDKDAKFPDDFDPTAHGMVLKIL